jgi:lipoprotein-releasing system permease protein
MTLAFFIAKRLAFNKQRNFTSFIIKIAISAIAISVCVMILGAAITSGYQKVIQEKFYEAWGDIHVTPFLPEPNSLLNEETIIYDDKLKQNLSSIQDVKQVSSFRLQPCIVKAKEEIEGMVLKGIQLNQRNVSIQSYLIEGENFNLTNGPYNQEIIISKKMATTLRLQIGSPILLYFLNENEFQPKIRKVNVCGIYKTGLEEFDDIIGICDMRLIQSVKDDSLESIHGYEIYIDNLMHKDDIINKMNQLLQSSDLQVYPIEQRFESIFSWLALMKSNQTVIMIIMLIIAIINMISAFLILILERTRMVGILKALGMRSNQLIQIFIISSAFILIIGISIGLILGIGLCWIQDKTHFFKLNEAAYFIQSVPIHLEASQIVNIVLITLVTCLSLLSIPAIIIKKLSPTKAIRFQ